jgi:hypothetical protein
MPNKTFAFASSSPHLEPLVLPADATPQVCVRLSVSACVWVCVRVCVSVCVCVRVRAARVRVCM